MSELTHYIGTKQISAKPMTLGEYNTHQRLDASIEDPEKAGYLVVYSDSYQSWSPKDVFEKAYLPMDGDGTSITEAMVEGFIDHTETTQLGAKTTVVHATLRNGFEIVESSSCVDPANYDHTLGTEICTNRIHTKVWELLGFLLQTARKGI